MLASKSSVNRRHARHAVAGGFFRRMTGCRFQREDQLPGLTAQTR
jgi:hypothetical protein